MSIINLFSFISGGVQRTENSAINTVSLGGAQFNGSTSGTLTMTANPTTTTYSVVLPAAQGSANTFLHNDGSGNLTWASAGNVTSVALSDGSTTPIYSISGSPVTSAGTLTFTLSNQNANLVFAGPGSGSPAQPTFRALVSADIPSTITSNTSGTASNITATTNTTLTTLSNLASIGTITSGIWTATPIGPQYGGTGLTSYTTGDTLYASASNTLSALPIGTTGQILTVVSGIPSWQPAPATGANTALSNLTSTAINQSLLPNASATFNLGAAGFSWNHLFVGNIYDPSGNVAQDITNRLLLDNAAHVSINYQTRILVDSAGNQQLAWSTSGIQLGVSSSVNGILQIANSTNAFLTNIQALSTSATYNFNLPATAGTSGQALVSGGGGSSPMTWATITSGTVTSVAFADASTTPIYNITGSPITSSGTLTQTLATQTANKVFAGPATGSAAQPTFRALVSADIPDLSATYVTQSEVGAASGVASLDGGGKVPLSQLPATLMEFQGNWNPNINTPTLVDGTGVTGYTYWVSAADSGTVAGLTDPSMTNFQIGDLVIYNGTKWVLVTPAAGVTSVNGAQGAVTVNAINQLTGDVTTSAASGSQSLASTIAKIQGTTVSGTTGTGNVVFSASPTLTGTALATNITLTGNLVAPTLQLTAIYGGAATLAANTTYALRWGMPSNSETAGKLYLADWNTASFDLFWAVGLYNNTSSTSTGTSITITTQGSFTLGTSDMAFGSSDQGRPVYLGSAGAIVPYSSFSPSSGDANMKLGEAQTSTILYIQISMMGVS